MSAWKSAKFILVTLLLISNTSSETQLLSSFFYIIVRLKVTVGYRTISDGQYPIYLEKYPTIPPGILSESLVFPSACNKTFFVLPSACKKLPIHVSVIFSLKSNLMIVLLQNLIKSSDCVLSSKRVYLRRSALVLFHCGWGVPVDE